MGLWVSGVKKACPYLRVCVCVCVYLYMTCLSGARYSQTQNHLGAQRGASGGRREGDG